MFFFFFVAGFCVSLFIWCFLHVFFFLGGVDIAMWLSRVVSKSYDVFFPTGTCIINHHVTWWCSEL